MRDPAFAGSTTEDAEWDYYLKWGQLPQDDADYVLEAQEWRDRELEKAPVRESVWVWS
jgi:hypothetical protein